MDYSTGDIPKKYKILDVVFGTSDAKSGFNYADATQSLGKYASELNADAVINISYQQREYTGQKKVCLSIANVEMLEDLRASCSMKRIPYFVVEDAGRTEVAYGTETVMAIGPCENEVLDRVTGKLRLFDS